jgi:hypothetical protein
VVFSNTQSISNTIDRQRLCRLTLVRAGMAWRPPNSTLIRPFLMHGRTAHICHYCFYADAFKMRGFAARFGAVSLQSFRVSDPVAPKDKRP